MIVPSSFSDWNLSTAMLSMSTFSLPSTPTMCISNRKQPVSDLLRVERVMTIIMVVSMMIMMVMMMVVVMMMMLVSMMMLIMVVVTRMMMMI